MFSYKLQNLRSAPNLQHHQVFRVSMCLPSGRTLLHSPADRAPSSAHRRRIFIFFIFLETYSEPCG